MTGCGGRNFDTSWTDAPEKLNTRIALASTSSAICTAALATDRPRCP
jgi:hypothetical protein